MKKKLETMVMWFYQRTLRIPSIEHENNGEVLRKMGAKMRQESVGISRTHEEKNAQRI